MLQDGTDDEDEPGNGASGLSALGSSSLPQHPRSGGTAADATAVALELSVEAKAAAEAARGGGESEEGYLTLLSEVFGHQSFRGVQLDVIRRTLEGKSSLAILPTGDYFTWQHKKSRFRALHEAHFLLPALLAS